MIKYAFTFKMIAETKIDESDNEFCVPNEFLTGLWPTSSKT